LFCGCYYRSGENDWLDKNEQTQTQIKMQSDNKKPRQRGKNVKTTQWLNIVIIVISGLVLAFTLIGRFMDRPFHNNSVSEQTVINHSIGTDIRKPLLIAIKIFDDEQLVISLQLAPSGWKSRLLKDKPLTSMQITETVSQWRALINQPLLNESDRQQSVALVSRKIQLYFAEKAIPLAVTINVSNNQQGELKTFIQFLSTNQLIVLPAEVFEQLVPDNQSFLQDN